MKLGMLFDLIFPVTVILCLTVVASETPLALQTSNTLRLVSEDKGDKSPEDPKTCSVIGEILGYIKHEHVISAAGIAYGYGAGGRVTHSVCNLIRSRAHGGASIPSSLVYTEKECSYIVNIVGIALGSIFGMAGYKFQSGEKDVRRLVMLQRTLMENVVKVLTESNHHYDSIISVPLSRVRRSEVIGGLQELVHVRSFISGNSSFDLTYRKLGPNLGSITIIPTLVSQHTIAGPQRWSAAGHETYGLQIHYTTRHSSDDQTRKDQEKLANNIAHYWARETATHNRRALVGFVEMIAPKGQVLYVYKHRKVLREANFYFKIIAVPESKIHHRYESVDSPCGPLKDFLELKLPGRDKEL